MPRSPGFFEHRGWYVTETGGVRTKLCPVEDGRIKAAQELRILLTDRTPPARKAELRRLLVSEVVDKFLDTKEADCKPSTYEGYKVWLRPFNRAFGQVPIGDLTYDHGMEYKRALRTREPGLSSATVNAYITGAKILLKWASARTRGYIPHSPWEEVKAPRGDPRTRIVTDREFAALLAEVRTSNVPGGDEDFRQYLRLLRHSGLRRAEACTLLWEDVRSAHGVITIPPDRVKTGEERIITLTEEIASVFEDRRRRFEALGLPTSGFVFFRWKRKGGPSVPDTSRPWHTHAATTRFSRLYNRCVDKGVFPKDGARIKLHTMRHTRVTELHSGGLPLKFAMDEAGHKQVQVHMGYSHPEVQQRVDAVRSLSQDGERRKPSPDDPGPGVPPTPVP